jgi:hypothetical protein
MNPIEENAITILASLVENKIEQVRGVKISELTRLGPEDVNDAVEYLNNLNALVVIRTMGTAPYKFSRITANSQGKHLYYELRGKKEEAKSLSTKKGLWLNPWFKYFIIPVIVFVIGGILLQITLNYFLLNKGTQKSSNLQSSTNLMLGIADIATKSGLLSINIVPINNIKRKDEIEAIVTKLRRSNNLRKITPLESGKTIEETPTGTYFYVYATDLNVYATDLQDGINYLERIKKHAIADMVGNVDDYYEVHYVSEDSLYLIGYVSADAASAISKLKGTNENKIVVSTWPWDNIDTLIVLPLNRIINAKLRRISIKEYQHIIVLDVSIK